MTGMFSRLGILVALLVLPATAKAEELVVDAASGFVVPVEVNGHALRLRVDPETSGYIILNPEAVARIGLRTSLIRAETRIGPVRLTGWSKVARVKIGETEGRRRIVWTDRVAVDGADGLIGPADMPYDKVTFALRPASANDAIFILPMEFDRSFGLYYPLRLAEQTLRIQFSTLKPHTLATAAAGAHIASLYGGAWSGSARQRHIEFGVERPARPMWLQRPLEIEGLRLRHFLIRTADNRGNLDLPPEPDADPDEIVVTGERGGRRQRARFDVTLGLDRLADCSRLTWDNISRQLTLHCANRVPDQSPVLEAAD